MDLQILSSTYVQRNFRKVLDEMTGPIVIVKGSKPVKVILPYEEYLEMIEFEEKYGKKKHKRS